MIFSIRKSRIFRFGPFDVNVETGELRKHGRRVRLQEKSFQVLVTLLEKWGKLVSREELRQRLWPADTFVGFDNGLNTAVSKLRDMLGDSAEGPQYIETLARRGYRFIAHVEESDEPAATPLSALQIQLKHIEPDIVVVEVAGKIVLGPECQQVEWLVSDLLRENVKKIIFDLSSVSHIDSTGVGIIVLCSGKVRTEGGELRVVGAIGLVERVLRMSKVDSIVALCPTTAAAVEGFTGTAERDR